MHGLVPRDSFSRFSSSHVIKKKKCPRSSSNLLPTPVAASIHHQRKNGINSLRFLCDGHFISFRTPSKSFARVIASSTFRSKPSWTSHTFSSHAVLRSPVLIVTTLVRGEPRSNFVAIPGERAFSHGPENAPSPMWLTTRGLFQHHLQIREVQAPRCSTPPAAWLVSEAVRPILHPTLDLDARIAPAVVLADLGFVELANAFCTRPRGNLLRLQVVALLHGPEP